MLAWYVNGTLAAAERDRIETALQSDAAVVSQLAWERTVQSAIKDDATYDILPDRGLFQTMQRIRAEAKANAPRPALRRSWFSGLGEGFRWSPALAMACGVVAIQFAVIGQMWWDKPGDVEYAQVRGSGGPAQTADAFIRIAFKPESTEGDLNSLLRAVRAEIVSGPSQLGDYYLLLAKQGAEDALNLLQSNANVEFAEIVNALPARR